MLLVSGLANAAGICDRSQDIQEELLKSVGKRDCSKVTKKDLTRVTDLYVIYKYGKRINDTTIMTELKIQDLAGLVNVKEIVIQNSYIKKVTRENFKDLKRIVSLDLSHNYIEDLPEDVFQDMKLLTSLELDTNEFKAKTFPAGLFSGLTRLVNLDLDELGLEYLPSDIFKDQKNLRVLDLKDNEFKDFESGTFTPLRNVRIIKLAGNPLRIGKGDDAFRGVPRRKIRL